MRLIKLFVSFRLSLSGIITYHKKNLLGQRKSPISLSKNPCQRQANTLMKVCEILSGYG